MSVEIEEFEAFYNAIYSRDPFPWQSRLTRQVHGTGWPTCIDLPTASGKTTTIDIAVFVLACQAGIPSHERRVGRRICFTVNRRVIVDEAYDRALELAMRLRDTKDGIIWRVAEALRSINEDKIGLPLDVAQLRGGIYRDRRWARSLTQPMVICTTADQLGSRLLFRGYGVSPAMQPIHAALTACDSLILLDEAHVTRAFSQTLDAIRKYRAIEPTSPPMRFVQMTATPASSVPENQRFRLDSTDFSHPTLAKRQNASKPAELVSLGNVKHEKAIGALVDRAVKSMSEARQAVAVMVNRVQTARDVYARLQNQYPPDENGQREADIHLVIGRMRPVDRDGMQEQLRTVVGPDRPEMLSKPCFVVATQCLEVGADYDFDALITECASIDALRQRFGRLNRRGRPIEAVAAIFTTDAAIKEDDPVYGSALKETWDWLTQSDRKTVDFGIAAFKPLWDGLTDDERTKLLAPAPNAAVLLPAHLDALCQTAPYPVPSPDVSYFIHGPQRDNAEVQVCWREDMGNESKHWVEIVSMLPPSPPECMTVPLRSVRHWMDDDMKFVDADIPIRLEEDSETTGPSMREVLIWRGTKESKSTTNPRDIQPGDTLVIPSNAGGWSELGHFPKAAKIDIAEEATAKARRQRVIRIHRDLPHDDISAEVFEHATTEGGTLTKTQLRRLLDIKGDFQELPYPSSELPYPSSEEKRPGIILRFQKLLDQGKTLSITTIDEEDDDDSTSDIGAAVSLADHTDHVLEAMNRAVPLLHVNSLDGCLFRATELHDLGKADVRFQAVLLGSTPEEAFRSKLLGKSRQSDLSQAERHQQRQRAKLPNGFRHEMLSVQLIDSHREVLLNPAIDLGTLLHLIAAHHGYARPFAPVVCDDGGDDLLVVTVNNISVTAEQRREQTPAHRLDSGVAERFWILTRRHGWWGLAWLESILRLADQQASQLEQKAKP